MNKIINKIHSRKIISVVTALAVVGSFAITIPAFAATTPAPGAFGQWGMGHGRPGGMGGAGNPAMRPAAFGTVTAISGDIITVNSRQGFASTSPTVALTVDATNATVVKNNATSSVSSIAVGDMIAAQGTLTGTNVVATSIRDGIVMRGGMGPMGNGGRMGGSRGMGSSTPSIGNGEPVVAGTVASVNGSSLTITTKSNVTYTVDASNAKILDGQATASLSNISVGDSVLVQGAVNGTSVTASSVVDQSHPSTDTNGQKNPPHSVFGGIGQFFMHLFGF
jgi:hypothetical protein